MDSNFWAAIAGAVVGGIIAFAIQIIVLIAAAKQRKQENDERVRALSFSLLFKMVRIHSNIRGFGRYIEERFAQAQKDKFEGEPWQIYLPLANTPPPVHFSNDEMAMLLSLKDDELFNELVSLDQVHNGTLDIFQTLNARRQALTDLLPAEMDGAQGESTLTKEQWLLIRPKMVEVNGLIEDARAWCKKEEATSKELLSRLHKLLGEKVGLSNKLIFKDDE